MSKIIPKKTVIVVGGGVAGLTTGILSALNGFNTKLVTGQTSESNSSQRPSHLGSMHAIASVVPHKIAVSRPHSISSLASTSRRFFERICFTGACGVRQQRHFVLFENEDEGLPEYQDAVIEFDQVRFDGSELPRIPTRGSDRPVSGWTFKTYFVESPIYLERLIELFHKAGGQLINDAVTDLTALNGDAIVNCAGANGWKLGGESLDSQTLIRGHYIKLHLHELPTVKFGIHPECFSYNYFAGEAEYPCEGQSRADVYFYPRTDGWILGGSRQSGPMPEAFDDWSWPKRRPWQQTIAPRLDEIDGISDIPEPIWKLNHEIIKATTGFDISKMERSASIGYRTTRKKGIRLEHQVLQNGVPTIHNYGHGGAGFSLSWGCAHETIKMLATRCDFQIQPRVRHRSVGTDSVLGLIADLVRDIAGEEIR